MDCPRRSRRTDGFTGAAGDLASEFREGRGRVGRELEITTSTIVVDCPDVPKLRMAARKRGGAEFRVLGAHCAVLGFEFWVLGRSSEFGVRSSEFGVRSSEFGVRSSVAARL